MDLCLKVTTVVDWDSPVHNVVQAQELSIPDDLNKPDTEYQPLDFMNTPEAQALPSSTGSFTSLEFELGSQFNCMG